MGDSSMFSMGSGMFPVGISSASGSLTAPNLVAKK